MFTDQELHYYKTKNIDPQKLVLGVPFYGVDFNPSFPVTKTYRTFVALNPFNAYTDDVDLEI